MFDLSGAIGLSIKALREKYPALWWVLILSMITTIFGVGFSAVFENHYHFILGIILFIVVIVATRYLDRSSETTKFKWSQPIAGLALVLSICGYVFWITSAIISIYQNFYIQCQPGIDKELCSTNTTSLTLNAKLAEIITVTENAEITDTMRHDYRRGSCSGRSYGEYLACLPVGAKIDTVSISKIYLRNGMFEPAAAGSNSSSATITDTSGDQLTTKPVWRQDDKKEYCALIPWSAASGGRTGIGECRYHGQIGFDVTLKGTIPQMTEKKQTRDIDPFFKTTYGIGHSLIVDLKPYVTNINNVQSRVESWHYTVEAEQKSKAFARDIATWEAMASSDHPDVKCLKTTLNNDSQTLLIEITCD